MITNELDIARVDVRAHEAIGENRPGRVELGLGGAKPEDGPIFFGAHADLAPSARHRAAQRISGIALGATLGHRQQEGLNPRGRGGKLPRTTKEIQIRNDDRRIRASMNDFHAGHGVARRRGVALYLRATRARDEQQYDTQQETLHGTVSPSRASSSGVSLSLARSAGVIMTPTICGLPMMYLVA